MPAKPYWKQVYEDARDAHDNLPRAIAYLDTEKRKLEKLWAAAPRNRKKEILADMVAYKDAIDFAEKEHGRHQRRVRKLCAKRLGQLIRDLLEDGAHEGDIVGALTAAITATAVRDRKAAPYLLGSAAHMLLRVREALKRTKSRSRKAAINELSE